jgi:hypothetical protein
VRLRSIALLLCLFSSLNAFATPRHRHNHRSSFRSYSTRSTGHGRYRRSTTAKNHFKREHPCRPMGIPTAAVPDLSSITSIRLNVGERMHVQYAVADDSGWESEG